MLTDRQILVLKAIVEEFIATALPVGSRVLSKKSDLNFSAATIRNDMADLEELGYLEKTHTSSGRVPSQQGYRFYVDNLVVSEILPASEDTVFFDQLLSLKQGERETAVKEAMTLLSSLTNYTSILLGPNWQNCLVQKIQFVPISYTQAVLILITDHGHVENRTITLPEGISPKMMEQIIKALDELLVGSLVCEVQDRLSAGFESHLHDFISYKEEILYAMLQLLSQSVQSSNVVLSGRSNILKQPDFADLSQVSPLIEMMEQNEFVKIIETIDTNQRQLTVRIGQENEIKAMENCTLITVPYEIGNSEYGKIALLGPTRMEYQKIIPLLEHVAKMMSDLYK